MATSVKGAGPPPTAAPSKARDAVDGALTGAGEWAQFFGASIRGMAGAPRYASETVRQTAILMSGTWGMLLVMNMFQGFTLQNAAYFLLSPIGAGDYSGLITGYALPRQTAPLMFGYVIAAKACCGMAAEIGAMRIQQEIDALEQTGVDPMRFVVGPRLIALLLFVPLGAAICIIGQTAGAWIDATFVLQAISGESLLSVAWSMQSIAMELYAALTMALIALFCGVTACFYGMRARGGPANVGTAVARSLKVNLVLVHVLAGAMSVMYYGANINLPLGG
ncbi:hypothetical protein DSM112329_04229 [Paraconexibacter sp. AEG42_29]|uniref:ABC transporter permease n=1 Tax=Paraconexibacter sp. AEG42_29 TaxID=2997339 RepID=A0AAU7B0C0_9ACTN